MIDKTTAAIQNYRRAVITKLLKVIVIALLGVSLGVTLLAAGIGDWETMIDTGVNILPLCGLGWLLKRGHLYLTSTLLNLELLALGLVCMVIGNGIHDVAVSLLPLSVLFAGLTLSVLWVLVVTFLSFIGVSAVVIAEITGHLVSPLSEITDYGDILVFAGVLGSAAIFSVVLVELVSGSLKRIAASELSYAALFTADSEALLVYEPVTRRLIDVNPMMLRLFGYSRDEALTLELKQLSLGEQDDFALKEAMLASTEEVQGVPFEWELKRKDGSLFWCDTLLRPIERPAGRQILAVIRDITERKNLAERVRSVERLEAVGQLAGGIAHDFNNQLTGIIGFGELLRLQLANEPACLKYIDGILTAAGRAADLTKNLLAFARKNRQTKQRVGVIALVTEVCLLLERSIDKKITLEPPQVETEYFVLGDATALQNAFLNLGLNARDAMPEGGRLRFTVETVTSAEIPSSLGAANATNYVHVVVSDTGVGMTKEVMTRACEPFFTTKERGTGMGLAAVYGTVKTHCGLFNIHSAPGEGTDFHLYFPSVSETNHSRMPVEKIKASAVHGSILVVDDEPQVAMVARRMLEYVGYRVETCNSGHEALARCETGVPFDLVLLDVMIPDLDGVEILSRLRLREPKVKAMFMSGFTDERTTERILRMGVGPLLAKPFTSNALYRAVEQTLENNEGVTAVPSVTPT